ncbi:hypothetical protein BMF94_7058 [Rhodotorula taiwanensis]|uniref:DRBM domain-containing protein n=1 Tax=Rhodotorula taiwanensis TaxID=741276 RepID=A0A2S5AZF8_9BASI|nr:hypothetical protein BMF94_7058 [Rhodotorula taiwanensis]
MLSASRVLRTAAQSLKPALATSSPRPQTTPQPRRATAPSTPEQWQRVARHRPPPTAPVLPPTTSLRLPKPPFVRLQDPSVLRPAGARRPDPSVDAQTTASDLLKSGRKRESALATARDLAKNALADLLVDTYPSLSPEASRGAETLLLGDDSLSILSEHYKLARQPATAEVAAQSETGHTRSTADLFRLYVAGLSAQEGEAFARQWMRQCLRSVLNHGYVELREQQKQAARLARGKEILSPMSHLRNFLRHRPELKPVWTIEVKGEREEYRATVELLGLKTVGSAKSVRMAKQNAAEKLMDLIWRAAGPEDLDLSPRDYPKLLTLWAAQNGRVKPAFECQVEKAPVVRCTLIVEDKRFVERGLSKRAARFLAAQSAMAELAISAEDVRVEPLRRPSQVRRRERFQQLLAERKAALRAEPEGDSQPSGAASVEPGTPRPPSAELDRSSTVSI